MSEPDALLSEHRERIEQAIFDAMPVRCPHGDYVGPADRAELAEKLAQAVLGARKENDGE